MEGQLAIDGQALLRLLLAALLGGVIGWERESAGKSAGLRTLVLVSMGAALFVTLSKVALQSHEDLEAPVRGDPIRTIQAIAIGIGFLGAGVTRVARGHVAGLTTAATIWTAAGIGAAAGFGHPLLAAGAALLVLFVLTVLRRFEQRDPG
jgi:putative Mg2+ transporter-C (MgtC) family protein